MTDFERIKNLNLPIYTRYVDHDIDHIAAELVTLHVHGRAVGCDVNF